VGQFPANDFGLFDMAGNVSEWCSDWFDREYYHPAQRENPKGPEKRHVQVIRGAQWSDEAARVTVFFRNWVRPTQTTPNIGFRCAMKRRRPRCQHSFKATAALRVFPGYRAEPGVVMIAENRSLKGKWRLNAGGFEYDLVLSIEPSWQTNTGRPSSRFNLSRADARSAPGYGQVVITPS